MVNQALVKKDYTDEVDFSLGIMDLGKVIAASGYFKDVKSVSQAVMKVLAGRDMGISPTQSLAGVHIVEGKPTIGGHLMAAAIKAHPDYDYEIVEHTNEKCTIRFHVKMKSGKWVERDETFTIEDARKAELAGRGTWKKYARNMLFNRTISNGVKFHCASVFMGPVYTPEELGAEVDGDGEITKPPEVEPAYPDTPEPAPAPEVVDATPEPVPDEPVEDAAPAEEAPPPDDEHEPPPAFGSNDSLRSFPEGKRTMMYKKLRIRREEAKLNSEDVKGFAILKYGKKSMADLTEDEYNFVVAWLDACIAAGGSTPGKPSVDPNGFVMAGEEF